jgi:hypothetical protein
MVEHQAQGTERMHVGCGAGDTLTQLRRCHKAQCAIQLFLFALINTAQMGSYGMSIQLLETVRDHLHTANLVKNEREFCEQWLAKSECYLRTLRFTNTAPSAEALATLSSKLGYYVAELAARDDYTSQHWAVLLRELRRQTQAQLETQMQARWKRVLAR